LRRSLPLKPWDCRSGQGFQVVLKTFSLFWTEAVSSVCRDVDTVDALDGEVFVNLAFANSPGRAEGICAGWLGQAECDAFLALIEPVSVEFGTVL
jgi:hypothetical protein